MLRDIYHRIVIDKAQDPRTMQRPADRCAGRDTVLDLASGGLRQRCALG